MSWRVMYASLPATLLATTLVLRGHAADWLDRLPPDDPGMIKTYPQASAPRIMIPAPQPPSVSQALPAPSGLAVEEVPSRGLIGAYLAPIYGTAAMVAALPGTLGQVAWEVSYVLGISGTPASHPAVKDDLADLMTVPTDDGDAAAAARSLVVTTPPPTAMAAPAEPATPAAAPPPPAATAPKLEAKADPGEDIDPGLLANFIYDRGERRPDGTFFVPKTLQRLFKVRTERVAVTEVPLTMKLPGQIVPNPHTRGTVESSLIGRYDPPPAGMPVLGDKVIKGQLLGYVVPASGAADRTQVRREVARLTTDIRMETENLEILKQFAFVPFREGKIYRSQEKLNGLRREREALLPTLQTHEVLRAPTTGVISASTAVSGQMIHPGDQIYEILDPSELWVEATAPDTAVAANPGRVQSATAMTPEGQVLKLSYVGSGLALKQQATPIMFSIDRPPDGLRVGRPLTVTVTVNSEAQVRRGLPVSRDAVTIGTDGVEEVWEQTGPETFLAHPVHVQDIDGATVLVIDGLNDGARVVVRGSKLMAQLQ